MNNYKINLSKYYIKQLYLFSHDLHSFICQLDIVICHKQGWIKCGSGEHRSQEMTRKIEEIVTLGYEEKEKREEEERGEKGKKKMRKEKEDVEIEELTEQEEGHGDDKLISSKTNEWGKLGWNWTTEMRKNVKEKTKKKLKNRKRERWIRNGRKTEKRNNK